MKKGDFIDNFLGILAYVYNALPNSIQYFIENHPMASVYIITIIIGCICNLAYLSIKEDKHKLLTIWLIRIFFTPVCAYSALALTFILYCVLHESEIGLAALWLFPGVSINILLWILTIFPLTKGIYTIFDYDR